MPSRLHLQSPNSVVNSSSSTRVRPTRPLLKAEDICVGCIVWLPDMIETGYVRPFRLSDEVLKTEGYYHPVVILGITPQTPLPHISELKICFAILTTFRGVTLSQYETTKESLRPSIAIVNTVNPGNSQYLHLENKTRLRKQSYVRLENVYETSISNLRSYVPDIDLPAYHLRLEKESYQTLMSLLSLDAQDYPATDMLKSARKTRNNASIPIRAPAFTKTQSAPSPDVQPYVPSPIATQDVHNPPKPMCALGPTATRNLSELLDETHNPDLPVRTSQFCQNRAGPASQPYGDMFVDLEIQAPPGLPPPSSVAYGTTMQLPHPALHRTERRRSSCPSEFTLAVLFGFFVLWLFLAYAGWLIWRMFGA